MAELDIIEQDINLDLIDDVVFINTSTGRTLQIQDEGVNVTRRSILNFEGGGVSVADDAANGKTVVTIPGITIQDESVTVANRIIIDFQGAGVTATDNGSKIIVTIPGGSSSGNLSGSLTATRVPFASGATTLTDSANFTFDSDILTLNGMRWLKGQGTVANSALFLGSGAGNTTTMATSRGRNIGIGTSVLSSLIDGSAVYESSHNVAIGYQAMMNATRACQIVAVGDSAGKSATTGLNNVYIGAYVGQFGTTASSNTGIGYNVFGSASFNANENTGIGWASLQSLQTGTRNVAVGGCLQALTTGNYNVTVGAENFERLTTQIGNVGIGHNCGVYNRGQQNTALGHFALGQLSVDAAGNDASFNTMLGGQAGRYVVTGDNNTYVGYDAGTSGTGDDFDFTVAIGANAKVANQYTFLLGSKVDAERNNYGFGGEDFGSGRGITFVKNATVGTTGEPTDGFWWYSSSGVTTLVPSGKAFKFRANALGGTAPVDCFLLENDTDAVLGTQQYSPFIRQRGRGFKTDATTASHTVDFDYGVLTTQNTGTPTGNWVLRYSVNGGAYTQAINVSTIPNSTGLVLNNGGFTFIGTTNTTFLMNGTAVIRATNPTIQHNNTSVIPGTSYGVGLKNLNAALTYTSGTMHEVAIASGYTVASGTGVYNAMTINPTINQTSSASGAITILNVAPTYTSVTGTLIGMDYNPTVTSVANHIGLRMTSGNILFGATAASANTGQKVLILENATTNATGAQTNGIVIHSKDSSAGSANATLALYTEEAPEATATFTQTHRIRVWWNNVEYWLSLDAV